MVNPNMREIFTSIKEIDLSTGSWEIKILITDKSVRCSGQHSIVIGLYKTTFNM